MVQFDNSILCDNVIGLALFRVASNAAMATHVHEFWVVCVVTQP